MGDRGRPAVFTIPVHRNFADALVNGLLANWGRDRLTLARGMVLVPNNRAARAISDAFVRRADAGLLLPRLVTIGDVGDVPGAALDPADGYPAPPAIDPLRRRFLLARLVQEERALAGAPIDAAEAVRLATELARTLDQLVAEDVAPVALRDLSVAADLSVHWQKSLDLFAILLDRWPEELAATGCIDLAERRNRLLRRIAGDWAKAPPPGFVVAAGITTAAPAVAGLLRTVARMERGIVVLPGIDLASPEGEWDAIAGHDDVAGIESHPQHHLRLLLDRMQVARSDVARWRWGDGRARQAVRARAVSNAFAPARFTAKWNDLPGAQRRLPGVRLGVFATPADEAQGIAIALREALETAQRTAALVTPDRALAGRVVAHLKRWGIDADDSAGRPLAGTPPGTLVLGIAAVAVERFAPVALLSLLKHPLVMAGDTRQDWLEGARALDAALRGPRPAPGLDGLGAFLAAGDEREQRVRRLALGWWGDVSAHFDPLEAAVAGRPTLAELLEAIRACAEALAGDAAWSGPAGRALGQLFGDLARAAADGPRDFDLDALVPLLRELLGEVAVRPPQGGHHRIAIWGLLEARLQSADLLILGGLNEGVWPADPAPDPWLAPRVRQELGLGGLERRVGLAARDLATALGGRKVLVTRSRRDARAPTVASRFLLRLEAMLGGVERDTRLVALAAAIDASDAPPALSERPAPAPPAAIRPRTISVTDVDRLKADPFAFYAKAMLRLAPLDAIDADPGPAWRGSAVHAVLDAWVKEDKLVPEKLRLRIDRMLADAGTHPVMRALWQPRLAQAIEWVAEKVVEQQAAGRSVIVSEAQGSAQFAGVTIHGRADRIDRLADGSLAIVDYKTGKAPSTAAVTEGFAMQLGLLGLIAEQGKFGELSGAARGFEYWSLAKDKDRFGAIKSPVGGRSALGADDFVAHAGRVFAAAAAEWLTGDAPFTAKLVPEFAPYEDYDQLMRRDEWYGRER